MGSQAHQNRCASYRQHTLPHRRVDQAQRIRQHRAASRRVASRSKPPNPATGGKISRCGIQADCLSANPPYGGPTRRLRYQRRAASRRAASRSKPPKNATEGRISRYAHPGGLPWRRIHPTAAMPM
nr:hypothetical protein [Methylomarinum sp. Ch1-1]MDP4521186.1 hypothetical protein [Methylomarinum sp. Ch1-1]